ncbi:MAG: transposase [Rhodobacteraceae bacterium]|nr:transposase [Paracoccaceae bacterium]
MIRFNCLLIGQWLRTTRLEAGARPQLRLDFMLFCGLGLFAPVPDETTRCRFRDTLVKGGVHDQLLAGVYLSGLTGPRQACSKSRHAPKWRTR